jgi:hypothetical protein
VESGPSTGSSTFQIVTAVKEKQPTWHGEDRRAGHCIRHAGNVFPVHEIKVRSPLVHVLRPHVGKDQPRVEGEGGSPSPGITLIPIVNVVSQDSVTVGGLDGGWGGHPGGGVGNLVAAQPVGGTWKDEGGSVFLSPFLGMEGFRERVAESVAKRGRGEDVRTAGYWVLYGCLGNFAIL